MLTALLRNQGERRQLNMTNNYLQDDTANAILAGLSTTTWVVSLGCANSMDTMLSNCSSQNKMSIAIRV